MVDPYNISTEVLHLLRVELALLAIDEGIVLRKLVGHAWPPVN